MLKLSEKINDEIIEKFISHGPYYTSYPTLGEWSYNLREVEFERALDNMLPLADDENNALYIHFPYCPKLCYFCICNVTITHDRTTINKFLDVIMKEIDMLFTHFENKGKPLKIRDVHLGGGTPSYLSEAEITALVNKLKSWIDIKKLREFAIEFDPRSATQEKFDLCSELGFNRVSMGIQDFRPEVQEAVNRVHSFEMVKSILTPKMREQFDGFNFDILYGLPMQTRETFQETLSQIVELSPDRITLLKYAHVPDVNKHMKVLDQYPIVDDIEKAWMFFDGYEFLTQNGWVHVGIDHFAKSTDSLAKAKLNGNLRRDFGGFASGGCDRLLGVGPSSTMNLGGAYFQNLCNLSSYVERVTQGHFPILSGFQMDNDDLVRRAVIESILCTGAINKLAISSKYNINFDLYFAQEIEELSYFVDLGMMTINEATVALNEVGQILFKRHVSKVFDRFLKNKEYMIHGTGNKQHL